MPQDMNESILVLMSTYNGECYLSDQIESIMNQKYVNVTLLIRDDGSVDDTKNIIHKYIDYYPGRIFLEAHANIGFAMSFSELLRIAYTKYNHFSYYAFSDQDDVWDSVKLYSAIQLLQKQTVDIPVTYCSNTTLVDKDLNFIGYAWKDGKVRISKPSSLIQNFATGCTMVFNKKAVELYVTHLPREIKRHDFLMYQLCIFLGKVIYDHRSYINYRQHGNNQIGRPNFWQRMKIRTQERYKGHVLEKQNRYFLEAYKDLLSIDDIELLSRVAFYKVNVFSKLGLLFDHRIRYNSVEANTFFILKIMLGYV